MSCKTGKLQEFEDDCTSPDEDCNCTINDITWSGSASCWGISSNQNLGTILSQILGNAVLDLGSDTDASDCDCATERVDFVTDGVIQKCGAAKGEGTGIQFSSKLRLFDQTWIDGGLTITDASTLLAPTAGVINITTDELFYPLNITAATTVNLPSGAAGRMFMLKRVDGGNNFDCIIDPAGTERIENTTTYHLKPGEGIIIVWSQGVNPTGMQWKIIARYWQPTGIDQQMTVGELTTVDVRLIGMQSTNFMFFIDGALQRINVDISFNNTTGTITYLYPIVGQPYKRLVIL